MFKTMLSKFVLPSQATLISIGVAFVIGFGGGLYISGKFHDADVKDKLEAQIATNQKSIEKSGQAEIGIIRKKDENQIIYQTKVKEIIKYVPKTIYKQCTTEDGSTIGTTLNTDAVGVLNGDLPNVQPANVGDAEVKTPSEIGLQELSTHIIEIKKMYEDLAAAHDGLVEYDEYYKSQVNPK